MADPSFLGALSLAFTILLPVLFLNYWSLIFYQFYWFPIHVQHYKKFSFLFTWLHAAWWSHMPDTLMIQKFPLHCWTLPTAHSFSQWPSWHLPLKVHSGISGLANPQIWFPSYITLLSSKWESYNLVIKNQKSSGYPWHILHLTYYPLKSLGPLLE